MVKVKKKQSKTWCNKLLNLRKQTDWDNSSPMPTKMTGVLTLRRRECSPVLLEFPDRGKRLPVLNATNCSLQSAGASGGNRLAGRVTEARATEFWRKKRAKHTISLPVCLDYCECRYNKLLMALYVVIEATSRRTMGCSYLTFRGKLLREVLWEPVLQRKRSCCSWADSDVSIPRLTVETSRRWYAVQVIPVKCAVRIKCASITMFLDTCMYRRRETTKIICI